jgi:hypothetical protein
MVVAFTTHFHGQRQIRSKPSLHSLSPAICTSASMLGCVLKDLDGSVQEEPRDLVAPHWQWADVGLLMVANATHRDRTEFAKTNEHRRSLMAAKH